MLFFTEDKKLHLLVYKKIYSCIWKSENDFEISETLPATKELLLPYYSSLCTKQFLFIKFFRIFKNNGDTQVTLP